GLARCAEIHDDGDSALDHYHAACTTVAELRQRLASEEISSSLYAQAAQLHTDALRFATKNKAHALLFELSERQRALALQRMLVTHLARTPDAYRARHETLRLQLNTILASDSDSAHELDAVPAPYSDLLLRAQHDIPLRVDTATGLEQTAFDVE